MQKLKLRKKPRIVVVDKKTDPKLELPVHLPLVTKVKTGLNAPCSNDTTMCLEKHMALLLTSTAR